MQNIEHCCWRQIVVYRPSGKSGGAFLALMKLLNDHYKFWKLGIPRIETICKKYDCLKKCKDMGIETTAQTTHCKCLIYRYNLFTSEELKTMG